MKELNQNQEQIIETQISDKCIYAEGVFQAHQKYIKKLTKIGTTLIEVIGKVNHSTIDSALKANICTTLQSVTNSCNLNDISKVIPY